MTRKAKRSLVVLKTIMSAALIFLAAASAIPILGSATASAKAPGRVHCYKGVCHRVKTLAETTAAIGVIETITASFYGSPKNDPFNPRAETSSGEIFQAHEDDTVASPNYPDGTKLLIWHPRTRHAAIARVNNAGPYFGNRRLDLSTGLAKRLGFYHRGIARLKVVVVYAPTRRETGYRRGRKYKPVPGYIGRFKSLALAVLADEAGHAGLELRPANSRKTKRAPLVAGYVKRDATAGRKTSKDRSARVAAVQPVTKPDTKKSAQARPMSNARIPRRRTPQRKPSNSTARELAAINASGAPPALAAKKRAAPRRVKVKARCIGSAWPACAF